MLANGAVSARYGNDETFPGLARPADFLCTDIPVEVKGFMAAKAPWVKAVY